MNGNDTTTVKETAKAYKTLIRTRRKDVTVADKIKTVGDLRAGLTKLCLGAFSFSLGGGRSDSGRAAPHPAHGYLGRSPEAGAC